MTHDASRARVLFMGRKPVAAEALRWLLARFRHL